jgi:phospholipase/carboxylesterase
LIPLARPLDEHPLGKGFFMASINVSASRPAEGFYTSEVATTARPLPVRTFLPAGYEPRYPYPLLVFFHGHGGTEEQILRLAPRLSRRNYISIGLRGPVSTDPRGGYSWGGSAYLPLVEDYLVRAVLQTRRTYHVHSERIYLAGFAEGATLAYRLGLDLAGRVAGVISFNGCMPRHQRPLLRLPEARDLRVFIAHGIANAVVPLSLARDDARLLASAGLAVNLHTYPTNHRLHPDMLRDLNRWIITRCSED